MENGKTKCNVRVFLKKYKEKPVLWDSDNEHYDDPLLKEIAWKEVSDETGYAAESCKSTVASLLSLYRREISRVSESEYGTVPSTSDGRPNNRDERSWFKYNILQFLESKDNVQRTLNTIYEADELMENSLKSDTVRRNNFNVDNGMAAADVWPDNNNKRKSNSEDDVLNEAFNNALSFAQEKKPRSNPSSRHGAYSLHKNNDTADQGNYEKNYYRGYGSTSSSAFNIPSSFMDSTHNVPEPVNFSPSMMVSNLKRSLSSPSRGNLSLQTSKYGRDKTTSPVTTDTDDMELSQIKKRKSD